MAVSDRNIRFTINGKQYSVGKEVDPETSLADYIRDYALLKGTKIMCREGGCGACVVTLSTDGRNGQVKHCAINSCLLPVKSCQGAVVTTVEGLGNKKTGYSPIQTRLADLNGSQCGFCSPGMVMSIYSLSAEKGPRNIRQNDVETSLEGNICRCTGYRPIMDAFKTLAIDNPADFTDNLTDLEDLGRSVCPNSGKLCTTQKLSGYSENEEVILRNGDWFIPHTLKQLLELIGSMENRLSYRLVAGNTGKGVYKDDYSRDAFIDISKVKDLKTTICKEDTAVVGSCVTLSGLHEFFTSLAQENSNFWYCSILAEHIQKIGSLPLRNLGTVGGNLMMKHAHPTFPSDVFVILETVGARVDIASSCGTVENCSLMDFLNVDMTHKILLGIAISPLSTDNVITTYKIMPRACNAYAYLNAGFCASVNRNKEGEISFVGKPRIIYGGINSQLIHAKNTEEFLSGVILNSHILQSALEILNDELQPEENLIGPGETYLKGVAKGLFYKFILGIVGEMAPPRFHSAVSSLKYEGFTGQQEFDTDVDKWPIHKPTPKIEARAQCSGEAEFIDDMPTRSGELHGAFVLSARANCSIKTLDPSRALDMDGVVAFFNAKNITTGNHFYLDDYGFGKEEDEEIFCSGKVLYAGQPLGLIVANSKYRAEKAAKMVFIEYSDDRKPVLTIKEAMKDPARVRKHILNGSRKIVNLGNVDEVFAQSSTIVEGEFEIGNQYHFFMENHVSVCVPLEDGMDVYCSTQEQDAVQSTVASLLNYNKSQVNVITRRLGGGFGGKQSRATWVASACAIAAYELSTAVRISLNLETSMKMMGGRLPYYCHYKASINDEGLLQAVDVDIYSDSGCHFNESDAYIAGSFAKNCYDAQAWRISTFLVKTDTPSNTPCRAPGPLQGVAIIENVMEHLARIRNEDPLALRQRNLSPGDKGPLSEIIRQISDSAKYDERRKEIYQFNATNRWKKKGISLVPMSYPMYYSSHYRYNAMVAILHNGGSVVVTHGGIECGQGINTKVAQVVARELGIEASLISMKPTNTLTNANGSVTGGSKTSELNCYAALKACEILKERMQPYKEKHPEADWYSLVEHCYHANVDLTAHYYYTSKDGLHGYVIHGAAVTEVEIDVLTGEKQIGRVDIIEDVGRSISPLIDIGQVEGGFLMALGLWTTESIKYDPITGEKLTHNTWTYKPPLNRDMPIDFRVTLLKNASHEFGVLRSKAVGEPPLCMGVSVLFALRMAIESARSDTGNNDWFRMDGPATIDKIFDLTETSAHDFLIT